MMKNRFHLLIPAFLLLLSSCKPGAKHTEHSTIRGHEHSHFDKNLANEFGADDYGMKKYVMAFLKRGPNKSGTKEERAALQRAHLDNIGKLANEGKLVLAGPFLDDGDLRGIYIFNVESLEKAKKLTSSDPAIKAGTLIMELHPWYGSAALMDVNRLHEKIAKVNI